MTSKSVSIRIPLGLYEILEREAMDRKMAIAQVIIERLSRTERIIEQPSAPNSNSLAEPAEWQTRMMARITDLGLRGFAFGPGVNWWPLDERGKKCAGPFQTKDAFDAWLTEQETKLSD